MKKKIHLPIVFFTICLLQSCVEGSLNSVVVPILDIYDVSPEGGDMAGGTNLTINASSVQNGATIMVGTSACTPVVISGGQITCTTSNHAPQTVSITITNPDGEMAVLNNAYTYLDGPTITAITPAVGTLAGGSTVIISGTNFFQGATVFLGANACTNSRVVSPIEIECITPANVASIVGLSVSNIDGQIATLIGAYTYQLPPVINSIVPVSGSTLGGTTVDITGLNFVIGATVSFGNANCAVNTLINTLINCTTAASAAGQVDVVVTNPDNQSATFTAGYNYAIPPAITSILPNFGSAGSNVNITITGNGFRPGALITVGTNACASIVVNNATEITCTAPAVGAGFFDVIITNTDGQSFTLPMGFNFVAAPIVTSIFPNSGFLIGGTAVSITGSNFFLGATAAVGGFPCVVTSFSTSQIDCTTTSVTASGLANVVVTNPGGLFGFLGGVFTFVSAPLITSVVPNGGPPAGGTVITINGSDYAPGITANLGGFPCTPVTFVNTNQITCTTSSNVAGPVSLILINPDTQTSTMNNAYTYRDSPTVSSVAPSIGLPAGGTSITITGTNFVTGATVSLGGNACTSTLVVSATEITCNTPPGMGGVNVLVTNPDTQFATVNLGFLYTNPPTLTSIAPAIGVIAGGDTVTIVGTNFLPRAIVTIGGVTCTPTAITNVQITCTTGASIGSGVVTVDVLNPDTQTASLPASFTYAAPPVITTVTPIGGPLTGGTSITIDGSNFINGATITIGGAACLSPTFLNTTQLTCVSPPGTAGAADTVVTNPNTLTGTLVGSFTYSAPPTLTSITPASGPTAGGTTVVIIGTGFVINATVTIGGVSCPVTTQTATQIDCTTGAAAAGLTDVVLTNPDNQSVTLTGVYTYNQPPTITSISPTIGLPAGGGTLSINGINFVTGATATVGGASCPVTSTTGTTIIECTVPVGSTSPVDVVVTNPDGQTSTLAMGYFYQDTAILEWVVGTVSPNPPNPDNYGTTNINITHTFTLLNAGNITSSTISVFISGADSAAWLIGTDNCSGSGNELATGASCTVQVTFLAASIATATTYSAILRASASIGGDIDNVINGTVP